MNKTIIFLFYFFEEDYTYYGVVRWTIVNVNWCKLYSLYILFYKKRMANNQTEPCTSALQQLRVRCRPINYNDL